MTIFGADDRVEIPGSATSTKPYSSFALLRATFPDGAQAFGSGVFVGPNDVLTAGHLVYSHDHGGWGNITVIPGYSRGSEPFGREGAADVVSVKGWVNSKATAYDYALVGLDEPLGDTVGYFDVHQTTLSSLTGTYVESVGYPGDLGYPHAQMLSSGTVDGGAGGLLLFFDDMDLVGGQSGSPVMMTLPSTGETVIIGLLVAHNPSVNVGVHFDGRDISFLTNAIAGNDHLMDNYQPPAPGSNDGPIIVEWGVELQRFIDDGYYNTQYPDVLVAGIDPDVHYVSHGWREGRDPNAYFDTSHYLGTYADIAAAGINPLTHYMAVGWTEGRDPGPAFDANAYRAANPDVAAAGINPFEHWLLHGQFEGRDIA
ncbi:trypsin-like serine peptidase [Roseospira visakhapatnamensis]|uniref:Serine protease n=1 Tax=Roseospira visakhapatnamensis TaxID=390880 RepID=A0A7W6REI3_9PROT|nr:trypsin-like peptidase domain-containing protein [Roseospira visakhapatnamensis]MBB4267084.1 V8-like Glu-specific endopeptidase [Roseospira visakhapatnamensis]